MLTSKFAVTHNYFYALGNTPATCLTQGIPPNEKADVLLLGCGDLRNLLFTAHTDTRQIDLTMCDMEKAIIARNIVILTLIVDHPKDGLKDDNIWNLNYHLFIDQASLDLLRTQAKKLYDLASSMSTWHEGEYGRYLRFCDSGTLAKVREVWQIYSEEVTVGSLKPSIEEYEMVQQNRLKTVGTKYPLATSGLRSAGPACMSAIRDIDGLYKYFWKHGCTDTDPELIAQAVHENPMLISPNVSNGLHYAADPVLGFHLARAYVPLGEDSGVETPVGDNDRLQRVFATIRDEFRGWLESYRAHGKDATTLRFFVGDAITFAHCLRHHRAIGRTSPATVFRDQFHFDTMVLDGDDYAPEGTAPLLFHVIETSNLLDHLAAFNLLVATSPLLAPGPSSSIHLETLVLHSDLLDGADASAFVKGTLGGSFPTIAMFLGLVPVELCTNLSPSSFSEYNSESYEQNVDYEMGQGVFAARQRFARMAWKRPASQLPEVGHQLIRFDMKELATALARIFEGMFGREQTVHIPGGRVLRVKPRPDVPFFHAGSFAAFLALVKSRVAVDWEMTVSLFLLIVEGSTCISAIEGHENRVLELHLWLHLSGVHVLDAFPRIFLFDSGLAFDTQPRGHIGGWKDMPFAVCITLEVPRSQLSVFTDVDQNDYGTPLLHCTLQSSSCSHAQRKWQQRFEAIQMGFGHISTTGTRFTNSFKISVAGDRDGWYGAAPLIVSFLAPTQLLLVEHHDIEVTFGIQTIPGHVRQFRDRLGPELCVYKTLLEGTENVYISQDMPNEVVFMPLGGFFGQDLLDTAAPNPDAKTKISASVDVNTGNLVAITGRLDAFSDNLKSALSSGCAVTSVAISPFNFAISIGNQPALKIDLPFPADEAHCKIRVSRKNPYIEFVAPVESHAFQTTSVLTYPVLPATTSTGEHKVVAWNLPYLNAARLPVVDRSSTERLKWLRIHLSGMLSPRESVMRDHPTLAVTKCERARMEFKNSLAAMFGAYAGLHGVERHKVFALLSPGDNGFQVLILVSALRLDLSSRSVILDAAVLPFASTLPAQTKSLLKAMRHRQHSKIWVSTEELRLWRQVLPAFVERCRTWEHKADCEYIAKGCVPLSVEMGEAVLCKCGDGIFPDHFMEGVPKWGALSRHAVRVAISPAFPSPFVRAVREVPAGPIARSVIVR